MDGPLTGRKLHAGPTMMSHTHDERVTSLPSSCEGPARHSSLQLPISLFDLPSPPPSQREGVLKEVESKRSDNTCTQCAKQGGLAHGAGMKVARSRRAVVNHVCQHDESSRRSALLHPARHSRVAECRELEFLHCRRCSFSGEMLHASTAEAVGASVS